MGKRSAVVELFLGDMGSMQRELRPSTQREDQLTMETKLEQIAVKAVNQLPKSVVREIRTPRSVGTGGGRPPPVTRWARRNPRPYRDHGARAQNGKAHIWKRVACGADFRGRDGGRHGDQATNKMPPRCADPCAKPRCIYTEFCLLQQSTRTDPECPPAM